MSNVTFINRTIVPGTDEIIYLMSIPNARAHKKYFVREAWTYEVNKFRDTTPEAFTLAEQRFNDTVTKKIAQCQN